MSIFAKRIVQALNLVKCYNQPHRLLSCSAVLRSESAPREEMDELKKNPYFEKYSKKITNLQSQSEEEFDKRVEEVQKLHKKPVVKEKSKSQVQQPAKPEIQQKLDLSSNQVKKLQDILKLDLIRDKSSSEISEIWTEHHKKSHCLSAVIQREKYELIQERAKKYNTFLFPLPRDEGYEFIICQFQNNECHFTTLLNYQTHKENAPECLTLIHFAELAESKGIVLMKGEYHDQAINAMEAQCLVNQLQLYYTSEDPKKLELLDTFINRPDSFKHNDLIVQLQESVFQ